MRQVCLAFVLIAVATGPSSAGKPVRYPVIPLTVTVHASFIDEAAETKNCGICGDEFDASNTPLDTNYTDGERGVEAKVDEYGNLIFNVQAIAAAQPRALTFDYPSPIAFPTTGTNQYLATTGGTRALQAMAVGSMQQVKTCVTSDDAANQRRYVITFERDCYFADLAVNTSYIKVTALGLDRWTLETEESPFAHQAGVFSISAKGRLLPPADNTYAPMPFKMTLAPR